MRTSLFIRLCAMLAVFGLLGTIASPASAGKPVKEIANESFPDEVCGIPVTTTITGHVILHIQDYVIQADDPETQDDFWIGVIQVHLDITWTNEAGVTVTNFVRETVQEGALVNNGDGTWTYTYAVNGKDWDVRIGNQHLFKDVGRITWEQVIYLGDLSTVEDNEDISQTITSISGPHPAAETDFELFCEVFTDIMG